jgi:hypothetical protein
MRRAFWIAALGLLPTALPLACGSLNKGEVVIVDEGAGAPNAGGASGSAGKGGAGTAGGTSGKGGMSGKGGGAGDAGEAGVGTGANGGSGNGGKGGSSNGGTGGSSNAGTSTGGSAGATPTDCVDLADCAGAKPICDDGTCRACSPGAMPDECAELTGTPRCDSDSGRCVECLGNADCSGSSRAVCDAGACRGCEEGSECDSGACSSGRCAPESSVVYALAGGGSYDTDCGTLAKPCMRLIDAAGKLSGSSPYLVLIETSAKFTYENAVLPPMIDIWVFGNHVTITGYDSPIFSKSGGTLYLDDVVVSAEHSGTAQGFPAVDLASVALKMKKGAVYNNYKEYGSIGLNLTDSSADIQQVDFWNAYTALVFQGSAGTQGQGLTLERCLFQNNFQALDVYADYFTIRNNLFVANGLASYTRIIRLTMVTNGVFAYNTLYGNDNNCSYEGGLVACGGAETCGVHSSNLFWGNMYGAALGMPCPDQVYPYPATIAYTIAEQTWAGVGNIDGSLAGNDPRLANPTAGDFTPSNGSPAIDAGDIDPAVVPAVDYHGNPRPFGDGPDIGAIEAE